MRKFLLIILISGIFGCNEKTTQKETSQATPAYSAAGKKIIVYTTAENTSYKLTPTDTLGFKHMGQPVET